MFIDIKETSKLYYLLNALIGAYNRRTDAWKAIRGRDNNDAELRRKIEEVINLIHGGVLVPDWPIARNEISLILELLQQPKPKPLEVRFVFKVTNDHQDESFSISIGGVTDAEGEALPDTKGLTVDVKSSDDAVVSVSFDPSTNLGVASFGHSGVASLTASVTNAKGEILGSGAADFTVTTGDPAAVSDVKIAFGGLTEEPTEPTP